MTEGPKSEGITLRDGTFVPAEQIKVIAKNIVGAVIVEETAEDRGRFFDLLRANPQETGRYLLEALEDLDASQESLANVGALH